MQHQQEMDYTKKLDAGLWRRLIGYMKPYHKHLLVIMATMAVTALCDALFPLLTREASDQFTAEARPAVEVLRVALAFADEARLRQQLAAAFPRGA